MLRMIFPDSIGSVRKLPAVSAGLLVTLCIALAHPAAAQDSDGDTLSDNDEINLYLTDPFNADTDSDGLRDDWEILGVPYTGIGGSQRYQLPRPPTNPGTHTARRKTILVEADSMAFPLLLNQAFLVSTWFLNVPVSNPDGSSGIDLIVRSDELSITRTGWTYNPGLGINWPPEFAQFKMDHFGTPTERANPDWFGPGQTTGPMRAAKLKAFRYVAYADRLGTTTISGIAEFPGNDMIVTLGGWFFGTLPLTPTQLTWMKNVSMGVFVHELGHNLGLDHGGLDPVNYKPNYHSAMNYSWTVPRYVGGVTAGLLFAPIPPTGGQLLYGGSWSPLYSDTAFPLLDENLVSETGTSLCGGCTGSHAAHVVPVGPPGAWGWGYLEFASAIGIDFDRDGIPFEPAVQANLNNPIPACVASICDGPTCPSIDSCPHMGFDDWTNLQYAMTGTNFANGVHGAVLPVGEDITFEAVRMLSFVGGCGFEDPFDFYEEPVGSLHERGGWKGWDNDPAFAASVSQVQAFSGSTSLEINGASDFVHEFCATGPGSWSFSAWQYIPSDFVSNGVDPLAGSYFVLLNTYQDGVHNNSDWSAQLQFDSNDGLLKVFHGDGLNTIDVPYVTDRWVKIQAIVDLDNDWTQIYYDDALVTEYTWTGGILGGGGGALDVGAVDLFANGSSSVFYDDLRLEQGCGDTLTSDADGDGLDLRTEYLLTTNPCEADSDEDGLPDGTEIGLGTDPLNPDSDGDGLTDGEEVNTVGTDPLNPDTDIDGVPDGADNCPLVFNPGQEDANLNGIGDACECPGDADGDGDVNLTDLALVLSQFGQVGAGLGGDVDDDGDVDLTDLALVLGNFGQICF